MMQRGSVVINCTESRLPPTAEKIVLIGGAGLCGLIAVARSKNDHGFGEVYVVRRLSSLVAQDVEPISR